MPTVRERNGKFHVQVRLSGFPPQSASFARKTDAKAWAAQTESAMRDGRHFPMREAKRHTLAQLVDRWLCEIDRARPHALPKQRALLGWWKDQLGDYALANIGPELIAAKRDQLLAEIIGTASEARYRAPATTNRSLPALSKAFSSTGQEY